MYRKIGKRLLDFLVSFTLLTLLSPILIIVTLLLFVSNKGKVFFFQRRPGKNQRVFKIVKFKTMTDATDQHGNLLPDKDRITWIGAIIRKTSLDEIPQLINVLIGDMSLIGPRPLLVRYLDYYTPEEQLRHTVLPGITGLAQISGRNRLDWDKRLAKDVEYVKNLSFSMDLNIFWETFKKVITSEDVEIDPHSIMLDLDEYRQKT